MGEFVMTYGDEVNKYEVVAVIYSTKCNNCGCDAEIHQKNTDAIERVRELHKPRIGYTGDLLCIACESFHEDSKPVKYPCPTIKALDGEQG